MSKSEIDPARTLVNRTEGFHKAKRNSLVWSAITIAAVVGVPDGTVKIEQIGLAFQPWQIIAGAWLTALFMLVGFVRADNELTILNRAAVREQEGDALGKTIEAFRLRLDRINDELDDRLLAVHDTKEPAQEAYNAIRTHAQIAYKRLQSDLKPLSNNDLARFSGKAHVEALENRLERTRVTLNEIGDDLNDAYDVERVSTLLPALDQSQKDLIATLGGSLYLLEAAIVELGTLDTNILQSRRLWHLIWDVAFVWGAFAVATALTMPF